MTKTTKNRVAIALVAVIQLIMLASIIDILILKDVNFLPSVGVAFVLAYSAYYLLTGEA